MNFLRTNYCIRKRWPMGPLEQSLPPWLKPLVTPLVIDYVFCALCMVCPGRAVSWNCPDCNRQSMQGMPNIWSIVTAWSVLKCLDTNVVFQTDIFLLLVLRNNKTPQEITANPVIAFPEFVYTTVILSYVSVTC